MKRREVIVIWSGIGLMVLMCLVPPWEYRSVPAGYHAIFWPGAYREGVDFERLGLQCLALIGLAAGVILAPRMWPKR